MGVENTPAWASLVDALLVLWRDAETAEARAFARSEFMKMARAADRYIAIADGVPGTLVATDMLTSEGLRP